jgi:hypothetical protein
LKQTNRASADDHGIGFNRGVDRSIHEDQKSLADRHGSGC